MGRSLLLLLLLLLAVPTAWAAPVPQQQFSADTVSGEVLETLGSSVGRGWSPVRIAMRNRDPGEPRVVLLEFQSNYSSLMARSQQERKVELAPGESRVLEMYAPCDRQPGATSSMNLQIIVNRQSAYINLRAASEVRPAAGRTIAVVSGSRMSDTDLSLARTALDKAGNRGVDSARGLGNQTIEPISSAAYFGSHGAGPGGALVSVSADDLPERPLGWSGVDTIVCDTRATLPRDPRWEVMTEWVRAGGQLAVVGPDAAATAARLPGVRDLLEERMKLTTEADGPETYRVGLGVVTIKETKEGDSLLFGADGWGWILKRLDNALPAAIDGSTGSQPPSVASAIYSAPDPWESPMERKPLPVRLVLFFLFLFAVAVGPAAVWWTRTKGRPDLLFLGVPALSIAATVILLAYGIGREGFAVKGNAHSVAVLDQRDGGLCTTVLRRELFVGRGGYALEPKPGTVVMVHDPGLGDRQRVVTDDGASMRLGGAFLPVREQTSHLSIRTAPSRVRIEVEAEGGGFRVTNGLGVDIESMGLRTPQGEPYRTTERIRSGETALLTPGGLPSIGDDLRATGDPMFAGVDVPRGGYVARVSGSPTADDCGVPMDEIEGNHVVVGHLPLAGKEWGQ